jgi:hypothetical protein
MAVVFYDSGGTSNTITYSATSTSYPYFTVGSYSSTTDGSSTFDDLVWYSDQTATTTGLTTYTFIEPIQESLRQQPQLVRRQRPTRTLMPTNHAELQRRIQEDEERHRRMLEHMARRQAAQDKEWVDDCNRALILLKECLSAEQLKVFEEKQQIPVYTKKGNLYIINKGTSGNVERVMKDKRVERFCIHPIDNVPEYDTMLAQKMLLETNEDEFRKVANITRY